jgi:hypothetical protein
VDRLIEDGGGGDRVVLPPPPHPGRGVIRLMQIILRHLRGQRTVETSGWSLVERGDNGA